ncbi:hypothetical protein M1555_03625 [Patescibacteria group bacterium]|nr:hypothetical protein [Patescibacteria group bacterium]
MTHPSVVRPGSGIRGLGTSFDENGVFLYLDTQQEQNAILLSYAANGMDFRPVSDNVHITGNDGQPVSAAFLEEFRIACLKKNDSLLSYRDKRENGVFLARSRDRINWRTFTRVPYADTPFLLVPQSGLRRGHIAYAGNTVIHALRSGSLRSWERGLQIIPPSGSVPDPHTTYRAGMTMPTDDGIAFFYFSGHDGKDGIRWAVRVVYADKYDPENLVWRSGNAVWEETDEWIQRNMAPVGVARSEGRLVSYWNVPGAGIHAITHTPVTHISDERRHMSPNILRRVLENPILKPLARHRWASRATFNPTAVFDRGTIHLIYRAIGDQDISVLGYATTRDGTHIDERLDEPIYIPQEPFELTRSDAPCPGLYASGGGYGGCEDPRITKIGDRFYLTYVAYNGADPPRVAFTSIDATDFRNRRWRWEKAVLISRPGVVDKNAVLFPEKINDSYVFLHRIFPDMLLDYVPSLSFDGTVWLRDADRIRPRIFSWDSRKIGAGPPPIKTPYGWLLIYHAVGDHDPSRYKIGAMLLSLDDPSRVLCRSRMPILAPDLPYENEGHKAGVVYPCGAVVHGNDLIIYYGGADTVICAAKTPLRSFLENLKEEGSLEQNAVRMQSYRL